MILILAHAHKHNRTRAAFQTPYSQPHTITPGYAARPPPDSLPSDSLHLHLQILPHTQSSTQFTPNSIQRCSLQTRQITAPLSGIIRRDGLTPFPRSLSRTIHFVPTHCADQLQPKGEFCTSRPEIGVRRQFEPENFGGGGRGTVCLADWQGGIGEARMTCY
jgi:hypothetical protein